MKKSTVIWIVVAVVITIAIVGGIIAYISSQTQTNNNATNTTNIQGATQGTVTIQNFNFSPSTIVINKGDTVTWQNSDAATHHIVADDGSFDLGDVANGATSKHTFDTTGTYAYHCSIHPEMKGTVVVK